MNCRHHIERASDWEVMGCFSEEIGNINAVAGCGSKTKNGLDIDPCMYTCIHCIIKAKSLKRMLHLLFLLLHLQSVDLLMPGTPNTDHCDT